MASLSLDEIQKEALRLFKAEQEKEREAALEKQRVADQELAELAAKARDARIAVETERIELERRASDALLAAKHEAETEVFAKAVAAKLEELRNRPVLEILRAEMAELRAELFASKAKSKTGKPTALELLKGEVAELKKEVAELKTQVEWLNQENEELRAAVENIEPCDHECDCGNHQKENTPKKNPEKPTALELLKKEMAEMKKEVARLSEENKELWDEMEDFDNERKCDCDCHDGESQNDTPKKKPLTKEEIVTSVAKMIDAKK